MINNPVLRGFCPDPSILRVGSDYYIAVSTFEWWRGVRIYHSDDLARWELISSPLRREEQLDMLGNPVNGGVWAPCLSYYDGVFYLAYSDVKCQKSPFHVVRNYAAKTRDIRGEWSDGVYVNGAGFDPSVFHDPVSGKSYWLNMLLGFRGITICEFDRESLRLTGEPVNIFKGTSAGYTEGPHMYYRDGWYYLLVAEGGTGYGHMANIARSKELFGEYELCPDNPVITSKPDSKLQKAGHASLVETADGGWIMAHLCSRPINGKSVLGRETALQPAEWTEDGWLRIKGGGHAPLDAFELAMNAGVGSDMADEGYSHLRIDPQGDFREDSNGDVTLIGREGLLSNFRVTAAAKRIRDIPFAACADVRFSAQSPTAAAGLALMYNNENCFWFTKTVDGDGNHVLRLDTARKIKHTALGVFPIGGCESVKLKVSVNTDLTAVFSYSADGAGFTDIGVHDVSFLCDEDAPGFTGLHAALYCHDLSGTGAAALFCGGLSITYGGF